MSKPFRFHPVDAGLSTQRISLTFEGEQLPSFQLRTYHCRKTKLLVFGQSTTFWCLRRLYQTIHRSILVVSCKRRSS